MKQSVKWLGLTTLLLINQTTHAVNPPSGWYGGLILGASYAPTINYNYAGSLSGFPRDIKLKYSVFGDVALSAGYRMERYRVEGELLFNGNTYKELQFGNFKIQSTSGESSTTSPAGMVQGLKMKGQTYTGALMINGFYDFFTPGAPTYWVPYVGAGVGYAYVSNGIKFYLNNLEIPGSDLATHANTPAIQGIVGINYFLDDFFAFGLDARYFTTKAIQPFNARAQIASINLSVSGSFCD